MNHGLLGHQQEHINILTNQYKKRETTRLLTESLNEIEAVKNLDAFNSELTTSIDQITFTDESNFNDSVKDIAEEALNDLQSSVLDAHDKYKTGKYQTAQKPTVKSHFGMKGNE